MTPPDFAIDHAVSIGSYSPCAKSKRGASIFERGTGRVWGVGYNAQPAPFECTRDARCKLNCSQLCEHAEQTAIRAASVARARSFVECRDLSGCDLVHAKVVAGALVAGGGPSCWQCSRLVLGARLDGVWLYQLPTVAEANAHGVFHMDDPKHATLARWRRYDAEEFHAATLKACGMAAQS